MQIEVGMAFPNMSCTIHESSHDRGCASSSFISRGPRIRHKDLARVIATVALPMHRPPPTGQFALPVGERKKAFAAATCEKATLV